jgi:predicted HTH transcriptional regulator
MTPLLTESELRALLRRDEGQFLEFKSLWDLRAGARTPLDRRSVRDGIAECVAAFANADGGTLLLGVEDSGEPSGHGYPPEAIEMEESFLRVPEFEVNDATFRVTLHNEPIFAGPAPEWQRLVSQLAISTPQRRVLLAHPAGFTNEDYRRLNQVDRDQAYREIQELVGKGILLPPESGGRGATYRLSPELHQARAWLESRVPRLRGHFRTADALTNTDYRRLFEVTRHTARRELRQLVQERYLELVGERRGARYLPGTALRDGTLE